MGLPRLRVRVTRNEAMLRLIGHLAVLGAILSSPATLRGEEITNSVGMRLRRIEAGRYERGERETAPGFHKDHSSFGAGDDQPLHPVVLTRPYYLATTEVTRRQFQQFVKETGYVTTAESSPRGMVGWDPRPPANQPRYVATFRDGEEFDWRRLGFEQTNDHPAA